MKTPRSALPSIIFCLGFLLSGTASAEEGCRIFDDTNDKYRIGQYAIGTPLLDFMTPAELRACIDANQASPTCQYDDDTGAFILAREMSAPRQTVVEYVNAYGTRARHPDLIAGIEFGDSMDLVREKLKALPEEFPSWRSHVNGSHTLLYTSSCLRASTGAIWEYLFNFSADGMLEAAVAIMEGYESPI